jgi:hypothetical protein
LNARNVREGITVPRKIKRIHLTEWNSRSIVNGVKSILFIRRPNRAVAPMVEHRSPKPGVGGSSPSSPARVKYKMLIIIERIEANMPVASLRDSKRRTESETRESAALQRTE